jgi:hypothetical protein
MQRCFLIFLSLFFLNSCMPLFAHAASGPLLTLEKNGEIISLLSPDLSSVGSLAIGDLGVDGTSEILVATGYGTPTEVIALRKDGSRIGSFAPYDPVFTGGASISLCDLNGDGLTEIITGAGFGGGPHVRVFSHEGKPTGIQFFAYDESFRGGVSVSCQDITSDGIPDIVTVPGPTGGPHIKVFSAVGALQEELFLSDFPRNTGLSAFILSHASSTTLFVTPAAPSISLIGEVVFKNDALLLKKSYVDKATTSPLTLTSNDGNTLSVTSSLTTAIETKENSFYKISSKPITALATDTSAKYIHVDISEQTLTAYEYGIPVATHPTPLGKTEVMAKLPSHDYSWFYGQGNPANYSLPNVLWNLRFRTHYYIHSAYWHNNFGRPMSHGCVNVSIPNAEKIFNWAEVGTPVEIIE